MDGNVQLSIEEYEKLKFRGPSLDLIKNAKVQITIKDFEKLKQEHYNTDLSLEGTVKISIKDFVELKKLAESYLDLSAKINNCTSVDGEIELSNDYWVKVITVDAKKLSEVAADFSDVERYDDDVIKIIVD